MKVSKQNQREAKAIFRSTIVDGAVDDGRAREAVKRLLETRPRGYLGILTHFERLIRLDIARRTAKVESAVRLSSDLQARVQTGLGKLYGAKLNFTFEQKPELLAGLRIQVGSDVYDGTVQARLAALEEALSI